MKCPHAKCWNANSDVIDTMTVKGVHLRRLACLKECDQQNVSEDEKDCWVDDGGVETYPDDIRYETDPEDEDEDEDDDDEDDDDDELTSDGAVRTRRYYV